VDHDVPDPRADADAAGAGSGEDAAIRTELPEPVPRPHPASSASAPLRIAVLAGGANSERNVSLSSGQAISRALRGLGHAVAFVDSAQSPAVPDEDPAAAFLTSEVAEDELSDTPVAPNAAGPPDLDALAPVREGQTEGGVLADGLLPILEVADVVFVTVFGDEGESGRTQRLLAEHGIAHTGPSAEVCELTFDKARTKEVLVDHGIDTPAWHVVRRDHADEDLERLTIAGPWIVKPVAGGSTIGLSKVEDAADLPAACALASAEGRDALVEEYLDGRDFTIGVLGDRVFAVVEASTDRPLYDYEAKYSPGASRKKVPADLSAAETEEVRRLTGQVHRLLGIGDTSSRADFRLTPDGRFNFFETNPLPGMTPTSSYPLSVGAEGVTFPELCEELVLRAVRRAGGTAAAGPGREEGVSA
jgi:D-alanine-D-alanine ligase